MEDFKLIAGIILGGGDRLYTRNDYIQFAYIGGGILIPDYHFKVLQANGKLEGFGQDIGEQIDIINIDFEGEGTTYTFPQDSELYTCYVYLEATSPPLGSALTVNVYDTSRAGNPSILDTLLTIPAGQTKSLPNILTIPNFSAGAVLQISVISVGSEFPGAGVRLVLGRKYNEGETFDWERVGLTNTGNGYIAVFKDSSSNFIITSGDKIASSPSQLFDYYAMCAGGALHGIYSLRPGSSTSTRTLTYSGTGSTVGNYTTSYFVFPIPRDWFSERSGWDLPTPTGASTLNNIPGTGSVTLYHLPTAQLVLDHSPSSTKNGLNATYKTQQSIDYNNLDGPCGNYTALFEYEYKYTTGDGNTVLFTFPSGAGFKEFMAEKDLSGSIDCTYEIGDVVYGDENGFNVYNKVEKTIWSLRQSFYTKGILDNTFVSNGGVIETIAERTGNLSFNGSKTITPIQIPGTDPDHYIFKNLVTTSNVGYTLTTSSLSSSTNLALRDVIMLAKGENCSFYLVYEESQLLTESYDASYIADRYLLLDYGATGTTRTCTDKIWETKIVVKIKDNTYEFSNVDKIASKYKPKESFYFYGQGSLSSGAINCDYDEHLDLYNPTASNLTSTEYSIGSDAWSFFGIECRRSIANKRTGLLKNPNLIKSYTRNSLVNDTVNWEYEEYDISNKDITLHSNGLVSTGTITTFTLELKTIDFYFGIRNYTSVSFAQSSTPKEDFFCFDNYVNGEGQTFICSSDDYTSTLTRYLYDWYSGKQPSIASTASLYIVVDEQGNETVELAISQIPTTAVQEAQPIVELDAEGNPVLDEQGNEIPTGEPGFFLYADIYRFDTQTLKWKRMPNARSVVSPLTAESDFVSYHATPQTETLDGAICPEE